ncbi:MAG: hypothetical protein AB1489_36070 [Acidobacteriota bacterium]
MASLMLSEVQALDADVIRQQASEFDLVFGAHCIESRCIRVPELLRSGRARKIAYAIQADDSMLLRRKRLLSNYGFLVSEYSEGQLRGEIDRLALEKARQGIPATIRVLVDVTSLPRRIIASIIGELASRCGTHIIDLSISYTLARYIPPAKSRPEPNKRVAPVHHFFAGWTSQPGLPVTALMGLGYESGKALGAREYLQASDWFLFVPNSPETRFRTKVEQHNRQLLEGTKVARGPERVMDYDVLKPVQTLFTLGSVVAGLKAHSKPILLPFGPKIFFATSALTAIAHPETAVWHVSGEENETPVDRTPSAYTTGLRCLISSTEPEPE